MVIFILFEVVFSRNESESRSLHVPRFGETLVPHSLSVMSHSLLSPPPLLL